MKRYILLFCVALMSLTGCKIVEGGEPGMDRSGRLLTNQVLGTLGQMGATGEVRYVIYADALLRGDTRAADWMKMLWFFKSTVTVEEEQIVFDSSYGGRRILQTGGVLLAEGVTWSLFYERTDSRRELCSTFVGVAGGNHPFLFCEEADDSDRGERAVELVVDYEFEESASSLVVVKYHGGGRVTENDYSIEFSISDERPLCFQDSAANPFSGEMEIAYKDHLTPAQHRCTVRYENYEVIYTP